MTRCATLALRCTRRPLYAPVVALGFGRHDVLGEALGESLCDGLPSACGRYATTKFPSASVFWIGAWEPVGAG